MHVAHSANMTKPGQVWFSDASKDPLGFRFAGGNFLKGIFITYLILPGDVKNLPVATHLKGY